MDDSNFYVLVKVFIRFVIDHPSSSIMSHCSEKIFSRQSLIKIKTYICF